MTQQQLRDAKGGSDAALDALFERYLPRVRAMVGSRLRQPLRELLDVEDIVQDTFRDALLALDRLDHGSAGKFVHWLAQCVENNLRDHFRRGHALKRGAGAVRRFADLDESQLSPALFPGDELAASQVARGAELEQRLEQAMLQLGDRYREVIALRVHGDLSHREIAQIMGLPSENTANVLFLRARARLRELLEA